MPKKTKKVSTDLSLFQITQELEEFEKLLIENGGEITEDMEEEYAEFLHLHEDKVAAYIAVYYNLQSQYEAIKAHADRLKKNSDIVKRSYESLKGRLLSGLIALGLDKVQTPIGNVTVVRTNKKSVTVNDIFDPKRVYIAHRLGLIPGEDETDEEYAKRYNEAFMLEEADILGNPFVRVSFGWNKTFIKEALEGLHGEEMKDEALTIAEFQNQDPFLRLT